MGKVIPNSPVVADLQAVCDLTCEVLGVHRPLRLLVTTSLRGRACYRTHTIRIPQWAIKHGELFAVAYVVHEVAHIATTSGHDERFKDAEERGLAAWDIALTRKRGGVYCEALTGLGMRWTERSAEVVERPASAIAYCPYCETNRRHYYVKDVWTCGKCSAPIREKALCRL